MLKKICLAVLLSIVAFSTNSNADIIYLKNGKKITSSSVWEEGGLIKCYRFGGVVSFSRSDIMSISKDGEEESSSGSAEKNKRQSTGSTSSNLNQSHVPWDIGQFLSRKVSSETKIEKSVIATVAINAYIATGSGFFVSDNGYILTNRHVVEHLDELMEKAEEIFEREKFSLEQEKEIWKLQGKYDRNKKSHDEAVKRYEDALKEYNKLKDGVIIVLADGSELKASVKSLSEDKDLALLKIDGFKTPYLRPSDTRLTQGSTLYAIGNPMNLSHSVTSGIFSGKRGEAIQMNIPLNPGNSGGPVITENGRAVGISTWKMSGHGIEGISFAIPIRTAMNEFRELRNL